MSFVAWMPLFLAATVQSGALQSEPAELLVEPTELTLRIGESAKLEVTVKDADGQTLDRRVLFLPLHGQFWNLEERTWRFNLFRVRPDGTVSASRPGKYRIMVRVPKDENASGVDAEAFLQKEIPLTVLRPPIAKVEFVDVPVRFYEGTSSRVTTRLTDEAGDVRRDLVPELTSLDPEIFRVDSMGTLHLLKRGLTTLSASAEGKTEELAFEVVENPTASLKLETASPVARTGDVVRFEAKLKDGAGNTLGDVPVLFSFLGRTDALASGGPSSGLIDQRGRFVADLPGEYTIVATSGTHVALQPITIVPREAQREIELVGHGRVSDRATSDLWVWEGTDGRDYAITGTHRAAGHAYIWGRDRPGQFGDHRYRPRRCTHGQ